MENRLPLPRPLPALSGKIIAGILAAALVVSGVAVYRYRAASSAAATSYTTTRVQRGTITDAVTGTGPIAASQAVPLNFKNSGKVAEIDATVGDKVKAGQVLAKLDDSDLRTQLQQAQANLANAQSAFNKLTQGPLPTDVAAAQAAIDSANTQLASARKALGAAQDIATKDVAAAQQALADSQKNLQSVQSQIDASTASDKVAVANAQQAVADAQKTAQTLPPVITQQIEAAKDKLYADQVSLDAQVGRGAISKESRQASLDADQVAVDQANAAAQQQLAQSKQSVNQAQSTLNSAQATLQNDVAKFQGQLVSAQTSLNQAQSTLASTQSKDNQSIQSAQSSVDSAASSVQTAQAAYNQKVAPPTQADLDAAQAQVSSQQANVQLAQNNLDAAVLTAPTDGTVTAISGAVGQWLSGGATNGSAANSASGASASSSSATSSSNFISLTSLSGLQVTSQVNESDISRVQIGQPITFTVDAFPNRTFTGKVAIIQPLGQNVSNVVSYTVTSTIDSMDVQLLPGMTATESIIINQVRDALEVPMSALTYARAQAARGGLQAGAGASQRGQGQAGASQRGQGQAGLRPQASAAAGDQAGEGAVASGAPAGAQGGQARQGGQGPGGQAQGGQGGQARQGGQGQGAQAGQGGQARQGGQGQGAQAGQGGQGGQGQGAQAGQDGQAQQGGQGPDGQAQGGQAQGGQAQAGQGGQGQGGQARGAQFEQPGGPGVLYLMDNGKPVLTRVQFGPSDGRFVQVISGVNEGDTVVTGGGPTPSRSAAAKPGGGFGGFGPGR